jgi:hypothetical protein
LANASLIWQLREGKSLMLMSLDLSHNQLGRAFATALPPALPALVAMTSCSLAHNNLGSEAGAKVIAGWALVDCV